MGDWNLTGFFGSMFVGGMVVGILVWEILWFLIRHIHIMWR
jgi:uncharacterized membrane protein YciS (DUF1049 family)